jgi:hypothetical protein
MRAFRSLCLPLKAVLLNLLSVAAAYGLLVIVFKWGVGNDVLGLYQFPQIEAWIPIFLFAMLFGLSMDYEVFLVTRMREAWDETHDNVRAVGLGLERTGRIVSAAAIIMVAAFSGFVAGRIVGLQEFGLGLAVAILVDATIVRVLLVPSLMALFGRWNWWLPSRVARVVRVPPSPLKRRPRSIRAMANGLKGVILAGGTGSRLHPLTQITNKHLLPIYDRPMISWAIEALVAGGRDRPDARHRRHARGRVLPAARQRSRARRRAALLRLPGEAGRDREALGLGRALRPRRPDLRDARRQRGRAVARAGGAELRCPGARARGSCSPRSPSRSTCATSACPSSRTGASRTSSRSRRTRRASSPSPGSTSTTSGLGRAPDARAVRPRRARDHRREQLVRRPRRDGVRRARGFWGDAGESIDAYYEVNDFVRANGANTGDRRRPS